MKNSATQTAVLTNSLASARNLSIGIIILALIIPRGFLLN